MCEFKSSGRLNNIDLIIPNIEFRLGPETRTGQALNAHLLISPDDSDHTYKIQRALQELIFEFDRKNIRCHKEDLVELGRSYEPTILDDKVAYREGVKQFRIHFESLRAWLYKQSWLRQNSMFFVAGGNDGLSGLKYQGGWGATRFNIQKFAHGIFSANPTDRAFWLGDAREVTDNTFDHCDGPKPCIHGCDAHKLEDLFELKSKRYCWIKADTTFQGLRQILYEPRDRVHIGETPPSNHVDANIIASVNITPGPKTSWFNETSIPANAGLVAIVGKRGSGKSALAELISFAAGAWRKEEGMSF